MASGGSSRLAGLDQHQPLRVLLPRVPAGEPLHAVIVNTGGGIVACDQLRIEVGVGAGAAACVTGQAAGRVEIVRPAWLTEVQRVPGTEGAMAILDGLYRYPVKGLSAEPLTSVRLTPGECLPLDRKLALARPDSPFDPAHPVWLRKTHFLMLMRDERLAALDVRYEDDDRRLAVRQGRAPAVDADLETPEGREEVEAFFEGFMGTAPGGRPRLVEASGHAFTDRPEKCVSLINLASVREIEAALERPVHPLRFRANLYVEGLPAWAEFGWVGREVALEDGGPRLKGIDCIVRCAATEVDPETAARDLDIPRALRRHFGHTHCGIYLRVTHGGELVQGQSLSPA